MKNKFIQKKFGKCLFYCLANLFNDEAILLNATEFGYHMHARMIVEEYTTFTLIHSLLHDISMEPVSCKTKIFDVVNEYPGYLVFIASVESSVKGVLHCILLFVDLSGHNDGNLIVLDPYFENSETMSKDHFFQKYNLYELEALAEKKDGGMVGLPYSYFDHLN